MKKEIQLREPNLGIIFQDTLVDTIKRYTELYGEYQYHKTRIYTEYEEFFTDKEIDMMVNSMIKTNVITKTNKKYIYENRFRTKTIFKVTNHDNTTR